MAGRQRGGEGLRGRVFRLVQFALLSFVDFFHGCAVVCMGDEK
jgi:hypothetical protein